MGFFFVQRQELHKYKKRMVDPMAAAGAAMAAEGGSGDASGPLSRMSQVSGLGMVQLGGKKHNDKEMLL